MPRGGKRPGAGRKPDPEKPARELIKKQLVAAKYLLVYALDLRRLGAQPTNQVNAAVRAAQAIIADTRQLSIAFGTDPLMAAYADAAAEASPLVPAIEAVLARTGLDASGFDGTASELLEKLGKVCSETERRARWYPATAAKLGSALRRVAPLLRSHAIELHDYKDSDRKRTRRMILRCASEAAFDELQARLMGHGGDAPG